MVDGGSGKPIRVGTRLVAWRPMPRRVGCLAVGVPAGDAAAESGRLDGVLPAVGAQRAARRDGSADGEGDPQLRACGGCGRAGLARLVLSLIHISEPTRRTPI